MQPSKLRRDTERGVYDIESVKNVFDNCFIAHVSYVDRGLPQCLPMIAVVKEEEEDEEGVAENGAIDLVVNEDEGANKKVVVYLHGHPSSRLIELVRKSSRENVAEASSSSHNIKANTGEPVRVCITATKVDGLVLSSAPNGHSLNYRSAVIHGTCTPVKSKAVKHKVMHAVTNHIVNNRWEEVNPVASYQISLVYVIKANIDALSVKTRTGPPSIQPRDKEKDGPDNSIPPWTGVIPLWEQLGEPVDSGFTAGTKISDSLREYIQDRSAKQRAHSERAASI